MSRYPRTIIGCMLNMGWVWPLLAGCAGGAAGPAMIQVPAEQRHDLTDASAKLVRLPEERTFNIHLKNSSQNPGPSGTAQGQSDAAPDGSAEAKAEGGNGGQATAEFTLGHRVNHQADTAHQVTIEVEFDLDQTIAASEPPAAGTEGSASLQLVVQNEKRQQIALMPLIQADSDDARASGSSHEKRSIVVHFEPRMSYDVYLYGKAVATSSDAQKATAELKLSDLKMRFQVAPVDQHPAGQASTARGA